MRIELITEEVYNTLLQIQKDHPILTFQNKGYEGIDKNKFTEADQKAFDKVTEVLRKHITGFTEFNNFRRTPDGELQIRLQYNWEADNERPDSLGYFTGVGYILVDELLNGFRK